MRPVWSWRWPGAPPDAGISAASDRVAWLAWLVFCGIRVVTLIEAAIALAVTWNHFADPGAVVAVLAVLVAENAIIAVGLRRWGGSRRKAAVAADAAAIIAALIVTAQVIKPAANPYADNIFYPYSVAAMVLAGIEVRRLASVIVIPALASAAYLATTLTRLAIEPVVLMNAVTYWCWSLGAFAFAATLRWLGGCLDQERRHAVELGQQQERAGTARSMHDHVLQTMEIVARCGWVADERLRRQIASEVTWLRAWLDGKLDGGANDLVAALADVAREQAAHGLRVELNTAGMADREVPQEVAEAISGAVAEVLANVRKHAGVTEAVVRAVRDAGPITDRDQVVVTVVDRGCGFVPDQDEIGFGLRNCVIGRVAEAGGSVSVTSLPGVGTQVEMSVPA